MSKLRSAIYGLAVGDAFGVPYEFIPRENILVADNMIGYGTHNQPPGTWSDDTSMTLATLDAFYDDKVNSKDIADNFLSWVYDNKYTPHGAVFDIGSRTMQALKHYMVYHEFLNDDDVYSNGNGSLMRILPLAFCDDLTEDLIDEVSAITHPHDFSKICCKIYVYFARCILMHPQPTLEALFSCLKDLNEVGGDILDMEVISSDTDDIVKSDGYVVHTLEAVFWTFFHSTSYKHAIVLATQLGNDTDTIAAITGGLAGLYYGYEDIPPEWINTLCAKDQIDRIIVDKVIKKSSLYT